MFLVLLDIILLLIIIQFAYIKIAFEMYGQYHLPRGKNPALSCLIGFVVTPKNFDLVLFIKIWPGNKTFSICQDLPFRYCGFLLQVETFKRYCWT